MVGRVTEPCGTKQSLTELQLSKIALFYAYLSSPWTILFGHLISGQASVLAISQSEAPIFSDIDWPDIA